jgi:lipopolysaccharide export system permease protein
VVKNNEGSFLILEDGHLERFEVNKSAPALVAFRRYAFDMSTFTSHTKEVTYGIHERYIWELIWPPIDDPIFIHTPGQYRAELHDRLAAPLYAFVFVAVTFAFLGSPRTTRQSRNFSTACSILLVFSVRAAGFACSVTAANSFLAIPIQYGILASTLAASVWIIYKGLLIEPPAAAIEAVNRLTMQAARLVRRAAPAA